MGSQRTSYSEKNVPDSVVIVQCGTTKVTATESVTAMMMDWKWDTNPFPVDRRSVLLQIGSHTKAVVRGDAAWNVHSVNGGDT